METAVDYANEGRIRNVKKKVIPTNCRIKNNIWIEH